MGRYDLITGKIKETRPESIDQRINRQGLLISPLGNIIGNCNNEDLLCEICGEPIPKNWLDGKNDFLVCKKKSCWEKFLPSDLIERFLKSKSRYEILKKENS
jgi:hypothetical protein